MYSCVLKNKEGIIFDEGKDFETLRETFKWASNVEDDNGNEWEACVAESLSEMSFRLKTIDGLLRTSGYATMNEANFDDIVKKCKCNEFGGTYYLRF